MNYIVATFLIALGMGLIVYRYLVRYRAVPIELISLEPYCVWEAVRGWGLYSYKYRYYWNGSIVSGTIIEKGIYSFSLPKSSLRFQGGVRSSKGLVSCNKNFSMEKLGGLLIILGIGIIVGRIRF